MTILLTGCAGFIGSNLLDKLLTQGHTVIGIDDFNDYYNPRQKEKNISRNLHNPNFTMIKKDICELTASDIPSSFFPLPSSLVIVHLAARAGVRASIQEPLLYEKVNVGGTLNLLEIARNLKVSKFIFGSSSSVYGNNTPVPFNENASCDQPISPYAATKRAAELMCRTYHELYEIPMTILRFFTVYGPRNRPDMAMYKFVKAIARSEPIDLYGQNTTRDYTYIGDIVDGIIKAIGYKTDFEIFNLGNSRPVNLVKLICTIENIVGKKALTSTKPLPVGDVQQTCADISKAKQELGWGPKTSLLEGLQQLWKWYQHNLVENDLR